MIVGDSVLFYKASHRKSAPRRRGPAKILAVDDAGATVKFHGRTFRVDAQDVGRVDWNPNLGSPDTSDGMRSMALGRPQGADRMSLGRPLWGLIEARAASPNEQQNVHDVTGSPPSPVTAPVPASLPLPFQVAPFPASSVQPSPANSLFRKNRTQFLAPVDTQGNYDHVTYDDLRDLRQRRGYARKDPEAVKKPRLATMDAVRRKRNCDIEGAADTSQTLSGKRGRAKSDAMDNSDDVPATQDKRCHASDLSLAFVSEKDIVKRQTQWMDPVMRPHRDASHACAAEGVGAAISARTAEKCSRTSDQELTVAPEKLRVGRAGAAQERKLGDGVKFKVLQSVEMFPAPDSIAYSRVPTWKMADGAENAKAHFASEGYRDPDLKDIFAETSGRVFLRSSDPQTVSSGALEERGIRSPDIKNALHQANGM